MVELGATFGFGLLLPLRRGGTSVANNDQWED
jgi:hypothetical protein